MFNFILGFRFDLKFLFVLISVVLFLESKSFSAVLTVGDGQSFQSINSALSTASNGDIIEVYSKSPNNIYNETINMNAIGRTNIKIIGMVPNQGITISGTGLAGLGSMTSMILCNGNGAFVLQNFTIVDNDAAQQSCIRLAGNMTNAQIKECTFSSSASLSSSDYYEIFCEASNVSILQNTFNSNMTNTQYYQTAIQWGVTNCTVKYNQYLGRNVYIQLFIGTTNNGTHDHLVSYNYFNPTTAKSDWLASIYLRDPYNITITRNLIINENNSSSDVAGGAGITMREDVSGTTIEYNTIIYATSGNTYESPYFSYWGSSGQTGSVLRNNILYSGEYSLLSADESGESSPVAIEYNYMYDPETAFTNGNFQNWGNNNTQTQTTPPGFVGSGAIWYSDGTDSGTWSQYYSLSPSAPALTSGQGGTYCGAFGYQSSNPPPSKPGGLLVTP